MMRVRMRGIVTLAVAMALAVLVLPGGARAQTSNGGGIQGFLDNMFTGSIGKGAQQAPRSGGSAQIQPAPTPSA